MTSRGLELKELAPGVKLERDVLARMEFTPMVGKNVGEMDPGIFAKGPMGLGKELRC